MGRWILLGGSFWVHGTCGPSAEPLLTSVEASRARPLRTFTLPATCRPRCSENPWPPSLCLPVPLTVILHAAARRAVTTPPGQGPLCSAPPVLPSHLGGTDPLVPHLAHGLSDLISRPPPPPASQPPHPASQRPSVPWKQTPLACFCVGGPHWPSHFLEHSWLPQPQGYSTFSGLCCRASLPPLSLMAPASTALPASASFSCISRCWRHLELCPVSLPVPTLAPAPAPTHPH